MNMYEILRNKAKKAVSKAMIEKTEDVLTELKNCQNGMFQVGKGLKIDSKEVEKGRCGTESDGKLCFSEKETDRLEGLYG